MGEVPRLHCKKSAWVGDLTEAILKNIIRHTYYFENVKARRKTKSLKHLLLMRKIGTRF